MSAIVTLAFYFGSASAALGPSAIGAEKVVLDSSRAGAPQVEIQSKEFQSSSEAESAAVDLVAKAEGEVLVYSGTPSFTKKLAERLGRLSSKVRRTLLVAKTALPAIPAGQVKSRVFWGSIQAGISTVNWIFFNPFSNEVKTASMFLQLATTYAFALLPEKTILAAVHWGGERARILAMRAHLQEQAQDYAASAGSLLAGYGVSLGLTLSFRSIQLWDQWATQFFTSGFWIESALSTVIISHSMMALDTAVSRWAQPESGVSPQKISTLFNSVRLALAVLIPLHYMGYSLGTYSLIGMGAIGDIFLMLERRLRPYIQDSVNTEISGICAALASKTPGTGIQ
ncbi:MAG: hypothetical protein K2X47_08520 [Bdellovibrionales bacterium]|nr:hypothetical protein [Bdellovibrionales bacterium]